MTGAKIVAYGATILDMTAATAVLSASITAAAGSISRTELSTAAGTKSMDRIMSTIATTGNTDTYFMVPEAGSLASSDFNGVDVLATSDSNYITFSIVNLGQAGAGTTDMLSTAAVNTTKTTGGTALAANTKRSLTVHGTAANLVVAQGDLIRVRAAVTGTLANTVAIPRVIVRFSGTT